MNNIQAIYGTHQLENNKKIYKTHKKVKKFKLNSEKITEEDEDNKVSNCNLIYNINPFILLNEESSDNITHEQIAKDKGKNILNILKSIRIEMINGELSKENLLNLKNNIQNIDYDIKNDALKEAIEDIKLRAEIEIAKIEQNMC